MPVELLQQVRAIDPVSQLDQVVDVLLEDGLILAINPDPSAHPEAVTRQDCQGLILGPGLVDLHSHSGEPGYESRETLETLAAAALAGGFTQVAILPDTTPPADTAAVIHWLRDRCACPVGPEFHLWGALTRPAADGGEVMADLADLAAAGVIGFSDGRPLNNLVLLDRLLRYGRPLQLPTMLWARDRNLGTDASVYDGAEALRLGLVSSPIAAESSALAAAIECIAEVNGPVHLMRISTARGVELIRIAKRRGLPITASTTWMHLLCDSRHIDGRVPLPGSDRAASPYDASLRLAPPLGNAVDRRALLDGLRDGTLDAIAIDHTPHTYEEKNVAFGAAPPGAAGFEFALPLLWHCLVETGELTALQLWQYLSAAPARCLGREPAAIAVGQPSELVLFDPNRPWAVEASALKSRSANTPWLGCTLRGQVMNVWR